MSYLYCRDGSIAVTFRTYFSGTFKTVYHPRMISRHIFILTNTRKREIYGVPWFAKVVKMLHKISSSVSHFYKKDYTTCNIVYRNKYLHSFGILSSKTLLVSTLTNYKSRVLRCLHGSDTINNVRTRSMTPEGGVHGQLNEYTTRRLP